MKASIEKDFSAIVKELAACAVICESTVIVLEKTNQVEFEDVISISEDCATTCRRGISLLEDGKDSAFTFLESCKEICLMCEVENIKFNNEHCTKTANACRNCFDFLNNL
jgi:hypothetical protein